jgi:hypothetical protein
MGEGGPKGRMRGGTDADHLFFKAVLSLICLPVSSPRKRGEGPYSLPLNRS